MGYNTDFSGRIEIEPPLNAAEVSYLQDFSDIRRCKRADGPLALVGRVLDDNKPPAGQPGLWCDFTPANDGTAIMWNESEKTYDAPEWIAYFVGKLLAPSATSFLDAHREEDPRLASFTADHVLNGQFTATGEDSGDRWGIIVKDNMVTTWDGVIAPDVSTIREVRS